MRSRALLFGQVMAVSLYAFDELAVTTMMPAVRLDLAGERWYGAVFSAYLLASLVGVIWAGSQTDRVGPLRPFLAGLFLFGLGNLCGAAAPTMPVLVAARGLQGLGGGCLTAVVYAVVNIGYAADRRPRILAYLSSAWAVPALFAPGLAGYVAEHYSWRYVFLAIALFLPVVALAALPGLRSLPAPTARERGRTIEALALALGAGSFLYGVSGRLQFPEALLALVGAVYVLLMMRALMPGMISLRTPTGRPVAIKFLGVFVFFGVEIFLPLALVELYGAGIVDAGLILTATALSWVATTYLQSWLADRLRTRTLTLWGLSQLSVSILLIVVMIAMRLPLWWAYPIWGLAGSAMGLAMNTLIASSMRNTSAGAEGRTSMMNGLADSLAIALASGLGGALLNFSRRAVWQEAQFFMVLFCTACGVAVGAVVIAALRLPRGERLTG